MVHLELVIDGQIQLSRDLHILADKTQNMEAFYRKAIGIIEERSEDIFRQKGKNVTKSPKWEALDPKTVKARKKRWGGYKAKPATGVGVHDTLIWTGNLKNNKTKEFGANYGSLTFNAPYAIYHHRGGKNLPKRAIIDLSKETNTLIVKALQNKINNDIGNFGRQI